MHQGHHVVRENAALWPESALPIMVETSADTAVLTLNQRRLEIRERACLITAVKHP